MNGHYNVKGYKKLVKQSISLLRTNLIIFKFIEKNEILWCPRTDSNRGPIDYKSIALPAELQGLVSNQRFLV